MKNKYGKIGISNYEFYNKEGKLIGDIKEIKSESIQYYCDNQTKMVLENAVINNDFIKEFKNAYLVKVKYFLTNIFTGIEIEVEDIYEDIKINIIEIKSEIDEVSTMNITIETHGILIPEILE